MNIYFGGGRSSNSRLGDLWLNKVLVFVLFFTLWSEVHALTVEWSLVSPYQLSQSRNNWYAPQGGDSANIDLSKGGQVAFVPAAMGYGLYNRAYSPREINLYLSKPKHSRDSSSEEHHHKKKRHHRDSSEEKPHYEPEHHREHHPEHHKSAKEELNDEHAEQAEISAGIAGELTKMSHFMRSQVKNHIELRDRELNQGNVEAAKKEQIIIDMYQDQIKYLEGIEKAQEAIMAGEVEMYYDKDGAGQKHGHPGHHGHGGDHEGHGNHHGGDHHHGADQPTHHHQDNDEDEDEGHHGHDADDEGEDEGHGYGGDDDDDEGHENGHDGDDDDDENEGHGGHHEEGPQGHHQGNDEEGHHENQDDDDGFYDANQDLEDNDDTKDDPDYEPGNKHKLDKRSPFISSYLPSLSGSDTTTPLKTPDTAAIDTSVKPGTGLVTSPDPSSATPYSTDVPATVDATATTNPTTPVVTPPTTDNNSGWLSMLGLSNDAPVYSPYALLKYMKPSDPSSDNLMSMFNVFSDPSNSSYLSNASTLMRVVMFFMPGTGIVDQVYFTMALSKIMWEAATMYYEGYGNTEIAVVVLGELVEAAYLSRRGEDSLIGQKILTPGDNIKIDGMDVPAFLKYIKNMKYPDLTETQESKLQKDLDNLITITYPNISPELKPTFTGGLKDTLKFLSLFNIQGDLHVENVDVNFSEVYIRMHSAFDDSPLEKIKKTILGAIDAIKSNFN